MLQIIGKQDILLYRHNHQVRIRKLEFQDIINNENFKNGDDMNDFNIMKQIGLSVVPSDGNEKIKNISDYICKTKGGNGAFRELVDLILENYNFKKTKT